jgi:hypothetical protein
VQKLDSDIEQLLEDVAGFTHDPLGFVLYAFEWGKGDLSRFAEGPDDWQRDFLNSIGDQLKAGTLTAQQAILEAVASGHGVGKSALVAWLILWALATCEDTRGIVTANTENQLKGKTWAELAKWYRLCICKGWFTHTATALYSSDPAHEKTWRIDMVPWSINNTEAFAGLHNQGKRILVVFDEGSAIPDQIWEVTEGALTDSDTEIIWAVFGNPTRNTGRLRECWGKFRNLWKTRKVDSRTVRITNKSQIQKWIDVYGEDSDFIRVRVKGDFPRAGTFQFISLEDVEKCMAKKEEVSPLLAKVMGIDLARAGGCQNVFTYRQGRKVYPQVKFQEPDTTITVGRIVKAIQDENPDAVFIDGGGLGGPIIDSVRALCNSSDRKKIFEINGGIAALDDKRFHNKRAEMWGLAREFLQAGAELPEDNELRDDLIGPEYFFDAKQRVQLERKEDMMDRGLASPDCGDSLALTFAQPVLKERDDEEEAETISSGWSA